MPNTIVLNTIPMLAQDRLFKILADAPSHTNLTKPIEDDFFLITKTPPEGFMHRKGKFWTCGHFSLKAVIEGKGGATKPIHEYSSGRRSRLTYLMTPRGLKKILRRYGLKTRVIQARNQTATSKIALLKEELKKWPLILLIGNGLTSKLSFSLVKAFTHWHYITLRGYNDREQIFYVYDSNTKGVTEQYLMKGTVKIPYAVLLKSRSFGASKLLRNYAIGVEY